ncbi:TonB-dependent receptor [Psychrosphaera sp. F3M07]|uniref:TonB-dependent receptor domain-containing protein n=1 Tax=Psychrosphaera sp. F3M07 TaxID=2841560 RepID=UPI001C099E3A|nr:TonB-dependent receptor [Psychrosphaera sp. F3M07]MBU2917318.1 TonB-dependent receptor [Psychrosphaera sp. F3M07]
MFNKKKISNLVTLALLGSVISTPIFADDKKATEQEVEVAKKEKKEQKVEKEEVERFVITGSFIPRQGYDSAEPMTIIDEEEMKAKGLLTIADVIESLAENSGYSEGDSGNLLSGFTVGAQEANFRGLGTGRTLVLINGRRIADYPIPFGGEQNGVDMGTIPNSAVARVEYLSAGASAIYGSDAVGGVVNIITKRDMEQTLLSGYFGGYEDGYGETGRLSFVTGTAFDKGSVTLGVEARMATAVSADEIEFMQDRRFVTTGISAAKYYANQTSEMPYASPEGYSCEDNGLITHEDAGEDGHTVCNLDASNGIAMSADSEQLSTFIDGRYNITNDILGFVTVMATQRNVTNYNPSFSWNGLVYGERSDRVLSGRRSFASDLGYAQADYSSNMWTAVAGVEGEFVIDSNTWYWDVSYSASEFSYKQEYDALKEEEVTNWIFDGVEELEYVSESTYRVDNNFFEDQLVNNLFRDATGDRDTLVGRALTDAGSTAHAFQAKITGTLSDFGFLYNPVQAAFVVDWNKSTTEINPDARSLNTTGEGWMNLGAVQADGERTRTAFGMEYRIPATQNLEITFATRFDQYDDASSVDSRVTSQLKFMYNITDAIKLRGGTSETFRAPDMFNIYGESTGFATAIDLLSPGCYDGENFVGSCPQTTVLSTRTGSTELEEEKGTERSLGIIFTPMSNVNMSLDWWKIRLNDMVTTESAYDLYVGEWQCANGERNATGSYCNDVNERVVRDPVTNEIVQVFIKPQNQEYVELEGIDLRVQTMWESEALGRFQAGLNHSVTLEYDWKKFADDDVISLRGGRTGLSTPKNRSSIYVAYSNALTGFQAVNASMFLSRQSAVDNYIGSKELAPYYSLNATVGYTFSARLNVRLGLNNITNEMPTTDNTNPRWPYFWSHLQSPMGRSATLSFSYAIN